VGIIQSAKDAVARKDFNRLDDIWTDMVLSEDLPLDSFFEIAQELKKSNESERALPLLEMLASHLETKKEYRQAIEVYKNMFYYSKDDIGFRNYLIQLYKKLFPDSEHFDEYIELSGLGKGEPIFKSIKKFEEFLEYDIGQCFYFEKYGIGEVVETRPSKKEIIIDFEKKKHHFLALNIARGLLTPVHEGDFLYTKYKDVDTLKKLAKESPVKLVKMILKNISEPLSASQIKTYLKGIIEDKALGRFWEKVRKKLEKDKHIKIMGRTAKTYTYIASDVDKDELAISAFYQASPGNKYILAEEYSKKTPAVFKKILPELVRAGNASYKKNPANALDILMLCDDLNLKQEFTYSIDTILLEEKPKKFIKNLQNLEHKKRLLELIKKKNPGKWINIFRQIMFEIDDFKLLDEIVEHLKPFHDTLKDIYSTIFSIPKQYPYQFQWMLKKMQNGELQEYLRPHFIPRLIENLNYVKGIKALVDKLISLETFDALLKTANDEEAGRIIDTITNSPMLEDYKKKDYLKIVEYHLPHLFTKKIDVIYTTEHALNKKKAELQKIVTVEIPENKKEISRAREFGDLSENFEYKTAKEKQDQLYQKVKTIESELKRAVIIDLNKINTDQVNIGTTIKLKNLKNGVLTDYTILGRWDTDLKKNIISNEAPIAKLLIKKAVGDQVIINKIEYEIVEIEKGL
jgi:transcription elongation factor GreA